MKNPPLPLFVHLGSLRIRSNKWRAMGADRRVVFSQNCATDQKLFIRSNISRFMTLP